MLVVQIRFSHYAPKDSADGIKELVVANDLDQVVAYVDQEHLFGNLHDTEDDGDIEYCSPTEAWWAEHPTKLDEAKKLGFEVTDENESYCQPSVQGPEHLVTVWYGGNDYQDVSDAFYGVTQWNWREYFEINEKDAAVLIRLGVAKDIRKFIPKK